MDWTIQEKWSRSALHQRWQVLQCRMRIKLCSRTLSRPEESVMPLGDAAERAPGHLLRVNINLSDKWNPWWAQTLLSKNQIISIMAVMQLLIFFGAKRMDQVRPLLFLLQIFFYFLFLWFCLKIICSFLAVVKSWYLRGCCWLQKQVEELFVWPLWVYFCKKWVSF